MNGQIYHVEIVVSDLKKSVEFYDAFLGWLGYQRLFYEKGEAGWGVGSCNFWVSQCKDRFAQHGYHRKRVGVNHIAFHADSRSMVDRFYKQHLLHRKIPVLYGGPKEYPWYSKGYYSVYFEDPDRIKLELAYVPEFRKPIATGKDKGALRAPRPSGQS